MCFLLLGYILYYVSELTSHIAARISHITVHISYITARMSHIAAHISRITYSAFSAAGSSANACSYFSKIID